VTARASPPGDVAAAWAPLAVDDALGRLGTGVAGLAAAEAERRLRQRGRNELHAARSVSPLRVIARQLASPLLLLLVFAAAMSALTQAWIDAAIVVAILLVSVALGAVREYGAETAAAALRRRIDSRVTVIREGVSASIPAAELVPGDLVVLTAGRVVPADVRLVAGNECQIDEAALTGESMPVEKTAEPQPCARADAHSPNLAWMGSHVRSGMAHAVVIATGRHTRYGAIGERLAARRGASELDGALRRFGALLTSTMLVVVVVVFASNVVLGRPAIDTLMFSIALAVGLSPELLPAILAINLGRGAQIMARAGVLVRHLGAIESLGSMDVLCTDKTGTLTAGVIAVDGAYDSAGRPAPHVLALAARNARLQAGFASPLDGAIDAAAPADPATAIRAGEIPYDFRRKRVSVLVGGDGVPVLVTKGAFEAVLAVCTTVATDAGAARLDDDARAALRARHEAWAADGVRALAVATRPLPAATAVAVRDERDLCFAGFVTFLDRPRPDAADAVAELAALGVAVKLVTGDSRLVAQHVARAVGIAADRVVTGAEIDGLTPAALAHRAETTGIFAEVDPGHKERIVRALRAAGHVVGFLGDGINDAPAMHAADTSLAVDHAVDVAREAAELVLLERDLHVIRRGIDEGRRTFANTLKYVQTTTSANLGNMISMAAASLFLPFLPLLAGQILLNNLLSDLPAIGMADDRVDPELVAQPPRWDVRFIAVFMIEFGALSSLFDAATFGLLLVPFAAGPALFRTGWFVESLLTELAIAMVVRTRRPLHRSRPGRVLLATTLVLVPLTLAIPYLPLAGVLGFTPLPPALVAALLAITAAYVAAAELLKRRR
jgi:Mg2+-importing ATPase